MSEHKKLTEQLDGLSHSAAIVVVTQKVEAIGQREAETREELMRVSNRVTEIGKCLRRILDDLPGYGMLSAQASEPVLNERVMRVDFCARLERRNEKLQSGVDKVVDLHKAGWGCTELIIAVQEHLYPLATKEAADD